MLKGWGVSMWCLVLAFCLGLGEFAWVGLVVIWSVLLFRRLFPSWVMSIPLLVGAWILAAHFNGYKFFGSPQLWDNRPLLKGNVWVLDHVEIPNVLVATDGSRHVLAGLKFRDGID